MVIRLNEEKATQGSMDAHSGAVFVMGSPQGGSPPADGTISFRRLTAPEGGPEAARKIRFYEEIPRILLKSNYYLMIAVVGQRIGGGQCRMLSAKVSRNPVQSHLAKVVFKNS